MLDFLNFADLNIEKDAKAKEDDEEDREAYYCLAECHLLELAVFE